MGVYYIPKKKEVEDFLTNYAGADVLGLFAKEFKLNAYVAEGVPNCFNPRFTYKMSAERAENCGEEIEKILKEQSLIPFCEKCIKLRLFEGTVKDMKDWLLDFANFLKKCGGYETN